MFVASMLLQCQRFRLPIWPLYFFLAIALVQISLFVSDSLLAAHGWALQFWLYVSTFLVFFVGVNTSISDLTRWMSIYISISIFWLATGWLVWLGGTSGQHLDLGNFTFAMAPAMKLAGPFNQGNIFAAGIGMAWIFAHWLLLKHRSWLAQLAVVMLTAGLFDTLSRGAWLAFIPCLAMMLYAFRSEPGKTGMRLCSLWTLGLIIGGITFTLSQPESYEKGFLAIAGGAAASLEARLLIWSSALIIFLNHPVTGSGWGQFANQFWFAKPEATAHMEYLMGHAPVLPSTVLSAHNLTLQLISEGGMLLCVGIISGLCFYVARIRKLMNRCSPRLPFALAALGFFIQAQINVSYSAAALLICASFFSGIAMAPWLKKTSLTIRYHYRMKPAIFLVALFIAGFTVKQSAIWFETGSIIQQTNVTDKASLESLVDISNHPRVRAIPLAWLTYQIAMTREHYPLLRWISPMLLESAPEIPFIDIYQVLFYSLAHSGELQQACEIGKIIEQQGFPGELNKDHYLEACSGQPISTYHFGH